MQAVNLIPAHRILKRKRAVRLLGWMTACGVYGVIVFVACAASLASLRRADTARLEQRIRTVNAQIAETRQQLDDLKRSYAAAERRLQATGAVGPLPDWSVLLSALAAETGEHVVLSVCALEPTPAGEEAAGDEIRDPQRVGALTLLLTGFGRTQRDVSDFVLRLERISLLDSVSLVSSRREPFLTDHATAFEIRCSIGGEKGDAP